MILLLLIQLFTQNKSKLGCCVQLSSLAADDFVTMSEVIWAMDRIEIPTKRKLKANRSFCYNWKVLSVCVLTSVCSVCCVVFMWISLGKMEQIKKEIITLSQRGHDKNSTTLAEHFQVNFEKYSTFKTMYFHQPVMLKTSKG